MFENLLDSLKTKGLRGATLSMYVYPDGKFTIVPFGQSKEKKWIGSRNLEYKIDGDFISMDSNEIINKIIEGLDVSVNYEEKGINAKKDAVDSRFFEEGKKAGFTNYLNLSILLLSQTETIRINSLKPVDKKGEEWVAKTDASTDLSVYNANDLYDSIKKYISTPSR